MQAEQDILQLRDLTEAGRVQFKERIVNKDDKYEIGCEMVAFSNSHGGRLIIGINDKSGENNALSYQELPESYDISEIEPYSKKLYKFVYDRYPFVAA